MSLVKGQWSLGKIKRSRLFIGERQRLAGCVPHLAGHLFNLGRALRLRSADFMKEVFMKREGAKIAKVRGGGDLKS